MCSQVRPAPSSRSALPIVVLKLLRWPRHGPTAGHGGPGCPGMSATRGPGLWVTACSQGGHHRRPQEDKTAGGPHSLVRHNWFTWSF